jgi:outer membrane receptor protein involved in Fe transport
MASRFPAVLLGVLLAAAPAFAGGSPQIQPQTASQTAVPVPQAPPAAQPAQTKPAEPAKKEAEDQKPRYEEQIVVTASKVEQQLVNAPATMSVINSQVLTSTPAQDYAGLFRAVPGMNVSQTSARDVNITSRGATSTLSTTQLALIDGRSIYLDFFGFIGWDFLPLNFSDVKQIEVIRGPASAIWGANAMTGVVNIITKSPRESQGTTFNMGYGSFNRSVDGQTTDLSNGASYYMNVTHAAVLNDRWSYRVMAGYFDSDAYARPVGVIDNKYQTPYPPFPNTGTQQPKFDGRLDYDFTDGRSKLTVAGGYAGTSGIIHTGIGPFQIEKGSALSYVKADYSRGAMRAKFFTNILDGTAPAILAIGTDGKPIQFSFNTKTYDFELSNISTVGTRHVLSYGGNVRHNGFALSIAPGGDSRNEQGVYLQDEMFLSNKFRWLVGGRLDHFDVLTDPVFSPRTTFMFKPAEEHTFRVSYNKAYRAPSLTNNYLDVVILNQINLGLINPALNGKIYTFPIAAKGNVALTQQSLNAYEIGYSGVIKNRASVSVAWYYNDMRDEIFFTQVGSYNSKKVPPGWPLPPAVLDLLILGNAFGPGLGLPSDFSYLNLGQVKSKGLELGLDMAVTRHVNAFANYSYQPDPKPDFDLSEINLPPNNRFNAGFNASGGRFFGDMSVTYQGKAYWQDVLDARYAGWTDAFTLVNGSIGAKWAGGKLITTLKTTNLTNQQVQQHIFGDVIKRAVMADMRISF